jgi:hypothetical protein
MNERATSTRMGVHDRRGALGAAVAAAVHGARYDRCGAWGRPW